MDDSWLLLLVPVVLFFVVRSKLREAQLRSSARQDNLRFWARMEIENRERGTSTHSDHPGSDWHDAGGSWNDRGGFNGGGGFDSGGGGSD